MKKFIIAAMFILAAIFPILFFPLLALTLITTLVLIPYMAKHGVWGDADKSTTHTTAHGGI